MSLLHLKPVQRMGHVLPGFLCHKTGFYITELVLQMQI